MNLNKDDKNKTQENKTRENTTREKQQKIVKLNYHEISINLIKLLT